jgi:hypothetical protein
LEPEETAEQPAQPTVVLATIPSLAQLHLLAADMALLLRFPAAPAVHALVGMAVLAVAAPARLLAEQVTLLL